MKSTIIYKLTDSKLQTRNGFQWELGKWQKPLSGTGGLCSPGFYHAYTHPLLAVLLNPIHANISYPVLFIGRGRGTFADDIGCKVGYSEMMISKRIALPTITKIQRTAFAILCAKKVFKNKEWNKWADKWLNGEDRSESAANAADAAARAAARAAADAAARAADAAAAYAADAAVARAAADAADAAAAYAADAAAAYAAYAADAAAAYAAAAYAAYAADAAAAYAADGKTVKFDLISIAKEAMKVK